MGVLAIVGVGAFPQGGIVPRQEGGIEPRKATCGKSRTANNHCRQAPSEDSNKGTVTHKRAEMEKYSGRLLRIYHLQLTCVHNICTKKVEN